MVVSEAVTVAPNRRWRRLKPMTWPAEILEAEQRTHLLMTPEGRQVMSPSSGSRELTVARGARQLASFS